MDLTSYLWYAIALILVVGMIFAVFGVLQRLGFGGAGTRRGPRLRRLSISDSLAVDAKRRLILVRRDGREHLVLLGPGGDVVIERDIAPVADGPDRQHPSVPELQGSEAR